MRFINYSNINRFIIITHTYNFMKILRNTLFNFAIPANMRLQTTELN